MIHFKLVEPEDRDLIRNIADWYFLEWKIPVETTIGKLSAFPDRSFPFQIAMMDGDEPIATGGLYDHVGLLDAEPRFRIHKHWLALIFTPAGHRRKGFGTSLCREIEGRAKALGMDELFLFTRTEESFYARMGWDLVERPAVKGGVISVMKKNLI